MNSIEKRFNKISARITTITNELLNCIYCFSIYVLKYAINEYLMMMIKFNEAGELKRQFSAFFHFIREQRESLRWQKNNLRKIWPLFNQLSFFSLGNSISFQLWFIHCICCWMMMMTTDYIINCKQLVKWLIISLLTHIPYYELLSIRFEVIKTI